MKKKVGIILGISIILFFIGFAGFKSFQQNTDLKTPVTVARVKTLDLESKIFSRGIVESKETREISSDQVGKLSRVYVSEGDVVKSGDILAEIDKSDLEYELKAKEIQLQMEQSKLKQLSRDHDTTVFGTMESARIVFEDATRNYNANKQLYEAGALSESDFKDSESEKTKAYNAYVTSKSDYENQDGVALQKMNVQVMQAEVDKLKRDIEKSDLKSPIDGTITKVAFEELDLVGQNDVIFKIEDLKNLKIKTQISEFDIAYVQMGQSVTINCDSIKGAVFQGKVTKISPIAQKVNVGNSEETSVEVEVSVIDKDARFKPNFTAEIEILTDSKKGALVIPYEAIYFGKDGKRKIYVVKEDVIEIKNLELGIEGDLYVEAKFQGIEPDDRVVMNPSDKLEAGELVTVVEDKDDDQN